MAIGSICKPEYNYFILTFSEINLIHKLYNIVIITFRFRLSITYLFEREVLDSQISIHYTEYTLYPPQTFIDIDLVHLKTDTRAVQLYTYLI